MNLDFKIVPAGTTEDYAKDLLSLYYDETHNLNTSRNCSIIHVENVIQLMRALHNSQYTYDFKNSYVCTWWTDVYDYLVNVELTTLNI